MTELCCHLSGNGDPEYLFNLNFWKIGLYEGISPFRVPTWRGPGHVEPRPPAAVEPEPEGDTIRFGESMVKLFGETAALPAGGSSCSSGRRLEPTPRLSVLKVLKETAKWRRIWQRRSPEPLIGTRSV